MKDDSVLDKAIFSKLELRQKKVALIIGKIVVESKFSYSENDVGRRILQLVQEGRIKGFGDITDWRRSEISLIND